MAEGQRQGGEERPNEIEAHLIRSGLYRTIRANGVWGGVTPHGEIHISFFSEYFPIPESVTYRVTEESRLEEVRRKSSLGTTRELEVGVMLTLGTAQSLRRWLDEKIAQLEKVYGDDKSILIMAEEGSEQA